MTLTMRVAQPGDEQALAVVGAATFLETYAHMIPGPDMVAHCVRRHSADTYAAWLDDRLAKLWVSETELRAPVGYLVMTRATLPVGAPRPEDLEVQRIYVLSRFQGTGMGHALMNAAIAQAVAAGAGRLMLGVAQANERALAFYQRQSFEIVGDRTFRVGNSIFADFVLARQIGQN